MGQSNSTTLNVNPNSDADEGGRGGEGNSLGSPRPSAQPDQQQILKEQIRKGKGTFTNQYIDRLDIL